MVGEGGGGVFGARGFGAKVMTILVPSDVRCVERSRAAGEGRGSRVARAPAAEERTWSNAPVCNCSILFYQNIRIVVVYNSVVVS